MTLTNIVIKAKDNALVSSVREMIVEFKTSPRQISIVFYSESVSEAGG